MLQLATAKPGFKYFVVENLKLPKTSVMNKVDTTDPFFVLEIKQENHNEGLHTLRCFHKFTFCALFSPFYIAFDKFSFTLVTNKAQRVVSLLLWISSIPWQVQTIYSHLLTNENIRPAAFFNFAYALASTISRIYMFDVFWLKYDKIIDFCNISTALSVSRSSKHKKTERIYIPYATIITVSVLVATAIFTEMISSQGVGVGVKQMTKYSSWDKMIKAARSNFFYKKLLGNSEETYWFDHLLAVVTLIGLFWR